MGCFSLEVAIFFVEFLYKEPRNRRLCVRLPGGVPAGRASAPNMRWLAALLTISALSYYAYGYQLDIDAFASNCGALFSGSCGSLLEQQGSGVSQQQALRRQLFATLWRCYDLLRNTSGDGDKLRVLAWDRYQPWLQPALDRFSTLYGVPVQVDLQPYDNMMTSIRGFQMPLSGGAPPPVKRPQQQQTAPQLPPDAQQQLTGAQPYAVWLHSSADTQELAEEGYLLDFGDLVEQQQFGLDWFGVGQAYRLQMVPYAGRTVAMPMDGTMLHLFYRRDVLQTLGLLQVPQTWSELVEFAVAYPELVASRGAAAGSDFLPQFPLCIARDTGCRHESYLQAIWSSIAQTEGASQPIHFDAVSMRPLLDSTAGSAAFRILAQLLGSSAPTDPAEGCSHSSLSFAQGRCALALAGFVPQMQMMADASLPAGAVVRVSELPGSDMVWDGGDSAAALTPCTPSVCPFGEYIDISTRLAVSGSVPDRQQQGHQQGQRQVLINRAPQAATSLLMGAVNTRVATLVRLVAFELLSYLVSPDRFAVDEQAQALRSVFPVRPGLLQPESLNTWLGAGYDLELMQDALPVLYGSAVHPNIAWGLRMAEQGPYNKLIGDVTSWILARNVSLEPWVPAPAGSASTRSLLTANASLTPLSQLLSLSSAKLAAIYTPKNSSGLYQKSMQPWVFAPVSGWDCLGLHPLQPTPPSARTRQLLLPLLLGILLPVAVACLLVFVWVCWSRTHAAAVGRGMGCLSMARRGSRKMHVPEPGVPVALCVTDIQDSTSLWESLPADTLARAVDIHHRCVRRLALRHGGYESATEGDSFILAFSTVRAAVMFALDLQSQLLNAPSWPKLLLDQEVCRPVYTRLPAGYPFSHAASSRTNPLSPRSRRLSMDMTSSGTGAGAAQAATGPTSTAATAAVGPGAAPRAPEQLQGRPGGSCACSGSQTPTNPGAAATGGEPSTKPACVESARRSAGGTLQPQLRHSAVSIGSGISHPGSSPFNRGRSLGDLAPPAAPPPPPRPQSVFGGFSGFMFGVGSSTRSRLHFPEPAAAANAAAAPVGGGVSGGGAAAPPALPPACAALSSLRSPAGWCPADFSSMGGASGAEDAESSPLPAPMNLARPFGVFNQQLSWPAEPPGSSDSICRPLCADGGVSRRGSLTWGGVPADADRGDEVSPDPEASDGVQALQQRHHPQHRQPQLHQQPQQQQHSRLFQQQQQATAHHHPHSNLHPPLFARTSMAGRAADVPNVDSEPLPVWYDSGPLGAANFSVYSNTTYVTTVDCPAGASVSFATNGRLWEDGDGDFVSSASNAVMPPPTTATVFANALATTAALGPASCGLGVAVGLGPGVRAASGAPRGTYQTLREVLQAAAIAGARTFSGRDERLACAAQPSASAAAAASGSQNHPHHHQHEHLMFRGLRVRVGISVAVPTSAELQYNSAAARMVYGGPCVSACKTLADLAHGGQVFLSARAHQMLAAECQGLGGKPPGTMVLQVALMEASGPPAPPPLMLRSPTGNPTFAATEVSKPGASFLMPSACPSVNTETALRAQDDSVVQSEILAFQSWQAVELQSPLPRVPEHTSGGSPKEQGGSPSTPPSWCPSPLHPDHPPSSQQQRQQQRLHPSQCHDEDHHRHHGHHQHQHQHHQAALAYAKLQLGLEPVYLVTSPTLSQRLALVPPPRFSPQKLPVQDVYHAPLGRLTYAVVRVPAAAALLRWDGRVAAESLRLFVQTAISELRRAPGAYLVSVTPADVRAAFPSPVYAVAWALRLRAALLRSPWPQELLQHELGEPVQAYEGGTLCATEPSQPPSESGTPRLRWTSLATFGRANGSREGSIHRGGGGGSGAGGGAGPSWAAGRSESSIPTLMRGAQRRMSGRPRVTHALSNRAELLRAHSTDSDADETSKGGLEVLSRMGASPPLRRHRHSIDSLFPSSVPMPPFIAPNIGIRVTAPGAVGPAVAAFPAALPEQSIAAAVSGAAAAAAAAAGGESDLEAACSTSAGPLDRQTRALALLADHLLRNNGITDRAADVPSLRAQGSGVAASCSGGGGAGSDSAGPSSPWVAACDSPSSARGLPPPSQPLPPLPPVRPHAFRRSTVDGVMPLPLHTQQHQRHHHHQPQQLQQLLLLQQQQQQQQRSRMAPVMPIPPRQRWPLSKPHQLQPPQQQHSHQHPEGSELAAVVGSYATTGTSLQVVESGFSFRSAGADIRAADGSTAVGSPDEGSDLGQAGDSGIGGAASNGNVVIGATPPPLRLTSSCGGGAGGLGLRAGVCNKELSEALPGRNPALSRLTTSVTSSYLYGDGSGAAVRRSSSGVSDSSGRERGRSPGTQPQPAAGFAPLVPLGAGPVSLGSEGAAASGGGGGLNAVAAALGLSHPRSGPLFMAASGSRLTRRRSLQETAGTPPSGTPAAAGRVRPQTSGVGGGGSGGGAGRRGRLLLRGLRIHVGIATGTLDWAISSKTHALAYTGRAVSRATRLSEAASSGKVLCDKATQRAILQAQQALAATASGWAGTATAPAPSQLQASGSESLPQLGPTGPGSPLTAVAVAAAARSRSRDCSLLQATDSGKGPLEDGREEIGQPEVMATSGGGAAAAAVVASTATEAAASSGGGNGPGAEANAEVSAASGEEFTERVALELQMVRLFAGTRLSVRTIDEAFLCEFRSETAYMPLLPPLSAAARARVPSSPVAPPQSPLAATTSAHASAPSNVLHGSSGSAAAMGTVDSRPARLQLPSHNSGPLPTSSSPRTPATPPTPQNQSINRPSVSPCNLEVDAQAPGGAAARRAGRPPRPPVQYSAVLPDSSDEQQQQQRGKFTWRQRTGGGSSPGLLVPSVSEDGPAGAEARPPPHQPLPLNHQQLQQLQQQHERQEQLLQQLPAGYCAAAAAAGGGGGGGGGSAGGGGGRGGALAPPSGDLYDRTLLSANVYAVLQGGGQQRVSPSSCSLAGASDWASGMASSAMLSTLSAAPSSMVRLSPGNRLRSSTTEGHMPYIICDRVDEEGEGCVSESGTGQVKRVTGSEGCLGSGAVLEGSGANAGATNSAGEPPRDGGRQETGDLDGDSTGRGGAAGQAVEGGAVGCGGNHGAERAEQSGNGTGTSAAAAGGTDFTLGVACNGRGTSRNVIALETTRAPKPLVVVDRPPPRVAVPCVPSDPDSDLSEREEDSPIWQDDCDGGGVGDAGSEAGGGTQHWSRSLVPGGDGEVRSPDLEPGTCQVASLNPSDSPMSPGLLQYGGGGPAVAAAVAAANCMLPPGQRFGFRATACSGTATGFASGGGGGSGGLEMPPAVRLWRRTASGGRPDTPRLMGARPGVSPVASTALAAAAAAAGHGWGFAEAGQCSSLGPEGVRESTRLEDHGAVEGEFEFVPGSRCCSGTGGVSGPEVTVRSLLQGRLLAQMAAASSPSGGAAAAAAIRPADAVAQSPMSPALLLTIGSSGRRGSANLSGSSYSMYNSGSAGGMFNPPTFAGLAQLPAGGPSEASSAGSSFRLVPPSPV